MGPLPKQPQNSPPNASLPHRGVFVDVDNVCLLCADVVVASSSDDSDHEGENVPPAPATAEQLGYEPIPAVDESNTSWLFDKNSFTHTRRFVDEPAGTSQTTDSSSDDESATNGERVENGGTSSAEQVYNFRPPMTHKVHMTFEQVRIVLIREFTPVILGAGDR